MRQPTSCSKPGNPPLLAWERTLDNAAGVFPSFHVIWAMLAASIHAGCAPGLEWLWWGWAVLVAASCVTTGQHPSADVAGGLITAGLAVRGPAVWQAIRGLAERIANSWRELRIRITGDLYDRERSSTRPRSYAIPG